VHPMFVTLFIETDADDELTRGQDQQRRARRARRSRSARVIRLPVANRDRPRRP
jgi:hypothetical protein